MNLSMEERGAQPQEPAAGRGGAAAAAGAGRFLTGDLSFFGVGSTCLDMAATLPLHGCCSLGRCLHCRCLCMPSPLLVPLRC